VSIGDLLRTERENRGLTLLDAENDTKIRVKYLNALEAENFAEIPGEVYLLGFLRNYARYLELDADELVGIYRGSRKKQSRENKPAEGEPAAQAKPAPSADRLFKELRSRAASLINFRYLIYGVAAIIVVVSLVLGINALSHKQAAKPHVTQTAPKKISQKTTPPKVDKLDLKVTAQQICWVEVNVDGVVVISRNLKPGETLQWQGKNTILLSLGNAGGATVTYNGKQQPPLGGYGVVITKKPFTKQSL
jgi:cytoskeleton protein RodZ